MMKCLLNQSVFLNIFYGINGLNKNIDIFQKIKTDIKKELLEKNPYNIIFNTLPFEIIVIYQNKWPTDMFANLITQYPEQTRKKVFDIFKEKLNDYRYINNHIRKSNFFIKGS